MKKASSGINNNSNVDLLNFENQFSINNNSEGPNKNFILEMNKSDDKIYHNDNLFEF